jgi:hypothetical protein
VAPTNPLKPGTTTADFDIEPEFQEVLDRADAFVRA